MGELEENKDAYMDKFAEITFKSFIVKLRMRLETFNVSKHYYIYSYMSYSNLIQMILFYRMKQD